MLTLLFMGILSAVAVLAVLYRLGIKRFLSYPALTDVTVSLFLAFVYSGTLGGMTTAIIGGLAFSGMVSLLRIYYGMAGNSRYNVVRFVCKVKQVVQRMRNRYA